MATGVWSDHDLRDLEREARNIMRQYKSWYYNQAVERFNLPLAEGGLGLIPLKSARDASIISLAKYVALTEGDSFVDTIREGLQWMVDHVPTRKCLFQMATKLIGENVSEASAAAAPTAVQVRHAELAELREKMNGKVVHGKYGLAMRSESKFAWLVEGRVDTQTTALVMAAQDAAIRTRAWHARYADGPTDRCRMCKMGRETVGHILAGCTTHQWTLYKSKHDEAARCAQWAIADALDLVAKSDAFHVPNVVAGSGGKVVWDPLCPTITPMTARRPDLLVWDYGEKALYVVEIGVANDLQIAERTEEKRLKY